MKISGARIELPREEYDALIYLRDVTFEMMRAKAEQLEMLAKQYELLQQQTKKMLDEQSRSLEHERRESLKRHELILKMQARLAELEPVRTNVPQPAFAKR